MTVLRRTVKWEILADKTFIIEKDDPRFLELLNVEDDIMISEAEQVISSGDKLAIEKTITKLFERLEHHASKDGDERKFRAIANRLLDAGDYVEIEGDVHKRLNAFVIPRLRSHPDRTDYWVKLLMVNPNNEVIQAVEALLAGPSPSIFDWQRFHLWKLALHFPKSKISERLLEKARAVAASPLSDNVTSQAIVFIGKQGGNVEREGLFARLFSSQKSYVVQRAIIIGIQELPRDTRSYFYERALLMNSDHKELIDYLADRETVDYGIGSRPRRHCLAVPRPPLRVINRGIGLARGKVTVFRLSREDYDY